jgi:glycogen synthase
MRILFATPEISDFVRVGGLAAVSAALPRALGKFADIRVVIPGYLEVLRGVRNLTIVGRCSAFAGLPDFDVGFGRAVDGLPYYVVVCLVSLNGWARHMATIADSTGVTTTYALRPFHMLRVGSHVDSSTRRGRQTSFTQMTGNAR